MKKTIAILLVAATFTLTSCGTIFGGKISSCQATKPNKEKGEAQRQVRPAALIFDIFGFLPGIALIIDFADGGIYKPCTHTTQGK